MTKRLSFEYVCDFLDARGIKILSSGYSNNHTKIKVQCKICKNKWAPTFGNIKSGNGCPVCNKWSKHSTGEAKNILKKHGVRLLSEYKNTISAINVKCECCNYIWLSTIVKIRNSKHACPNCAGVRRYKYSEVKYIVEGRGFCLLSKSYINNKQKILLRCGKCQYVWKTRFDSIQRGIGCPSCGGTNKLKFQHVRDEIKKRGIKLISKKYVNNISKLKLECELCKYYWEATFGSIHSGRGCPNCSRSVSQKKLFGIIKQIFGTGFLIESDFNDFQWLYNKKTKRKLHIDIFVHKKVGTGFSLAIEYDGEQHFRPKNFGGISNERAAENFKKQGQRDRRKNYLIKKNYTDVRYFVRFNYKELLTVEYIKAKLIKAGVKIP